MRHIGGSRFVKPKPGWRWRRHVSYGLAMMCLAIAVGTWWSPRWPSRVASVVAWLALAVFWHREGRRGA